MGFGRAFSPLLMSEVKIKAHFVEPMLLRRTGRLPQGGSYELKIDGFRAEAIKSQCLVIIYLITTRFTHHNRVWLGFMGGARSGTPS
jgi:hypothetical protein